MRWIVSYQKGSFTLRESYRDRDAATRRVEALSRDDTIWSMEVRDAQSGGFRAVPGRLGSEQRIISVTSPEGRAENCILSPRGDIMFSAAAPPD